MEDVTTLPLVQCERKLSEEDVKLFEEMQAQFKGGGVPFIRPMLPDASISAQALLDKLKNLPAIESPQEMVRPYLEEDDETAIKEQLRFNKAAIMACLSRLQRPDEQEMALNVADRRILQSKLHEMRFLSDLVPGCSADTELRACLESLVQMRNGFNAELHGFLPSKIEQGTLLSEQDLRAHQNRLAMLGHIDTILAEAGVDIARQSVGETYRIEHVVLITEKMIAAIASRYEARYLDIEVGRLQPIIRLRECLNQLSSHHEDAEHDQHQALQIEAEQVAQQLGFDTLSNAFLHTDDQVKKHAKANTIEIDVVVNHVRNLRRIEAIFLTGEHAQTVSQHQVLLEKTDDFMIRMNTLFTQSLAQRTLLVAVNCLEAVHPLQSSGALSEALLDGHEYQFKHGFSPMCEALLTHFVREIDAVCTQLGPVLSGKEKNLTPDNSLCVTQLLAQLRDCRQDERFKAYFAQATITVQGAEVGMLDLGHHLAGVVMGVFEQTAQCLEGLKEARETETLTQRITQVNVIGCAADSLRWFESMAFVGEKVAQRCQDYRDNAATFIRNVAIDLEKQLGQEGELGAEQYQQVADFANQLYDTQSGDALQPWLDGLGVMHDAHQRLQSALKSRITRLQEEQLAASSSSPNNPQIIITFTKIKREIALVNGLPGGILGQPQKRVCEAITKAIDMILQYALGDIQSTFDVSVGNEVIDVAVLSKKLGFLLKDTPAEAKNQLAVAQVAFSDSKQAPDNIKAKERCVAATHEYAKTMQQGQMDALRVELAHEFLSVCQVQHIHQTSVSVFDAKKMVDVFVHRHADFMNQSCDKHMAVIESYQPNTAASLEENRPESTSTSSFNLNPLKWFQNSYPKIQTATDVESSSGILVNIESLRVHLSEYQGLKQSHPAIYEQVNKRVMQHYSREAQTGDILTYWQARLRKFNQRLSDQLQQAVISEANQEEARGDVRLVKLIGFCHQLIPLDTILDGDDDAKTLSFTALHARYNDILVHKRLPQLEAVFTGFTQQDYKTANRKLLKLKTETPALHTIAVEYLQTDVSEQLERLKRAQSELQEVTDIKPAALATVFDLWQKLDTLTPDILQNMTPSIKDTRQRSLHNLPQLVKTWFERHSNLADKAIKDLNVGEAAQRIATLADFTERAESRCPVGVQDKLQKLTDQLNKTLEALHRQYDKDVLDWDTLPYATTKVFESLDAARDVSWQGKPFGQHWEDISNRIVKGIKNKTEYLQAQQANNEVSMEVVGKAINRIGSIWDSLPRGERDCSKVREQVGQSLVAFKSAISKYILRAEQDRRGRLKAISEFIKINGQHEEFVWYSRLYQGKKYREHEYVSAVREEITALQKKLLNSLNRDETLLREDVSILLDYQHYLGQQLNFVQSSFKSVADKLSKYYGDECHAVARHYATERSKPQAHSIKGVEKSLSKLNAFRHLCLDFNGEDKNRLDALLPKDFNEKMRLAFQPAMEQLLANEHKFVEGFGHFDISTIVKALDTAKHWDSVFEEVRCYVGTYSPDKQTEIMKKVVAVTPYREMLEKVSKKVSEIKQRILKLAVADLLQSQSDSHEQRREFYEQLNHHIDVLGDIKKLSEHIGAMGDAESIRCAEQDSVNHVRRLIECVYNDAASELTNIKNGGAANWRKFDTLYTNLLVFREACGTHATLGQLTIKANNSQGVISITEADKALYRDFLAFMEERACSWRDVMRDKDCDKSKDNLDTLVRWLIEFEEIATDLPIFREKIHKEIDALLTGCRQEKGRGLGYLQKIADKLKEDSSGKGRMVIDHHSCFRGTMIAMRNQATSSQTINEVLDALRENLTEEDHPKSIDDKGGLTQTYNAFKDLYDSLLEQYLLPGLDFDKNRETSLAQLKQSLQDLVSKLPKVTAPNPVWGHEIKAQIPEIMAHIFAIWTLRDSKAYFDAGDIPNRKECLKKPHPAQVVGVFRMTGVGLPDNQFDNHLVEILTGEGKSVCMAVAASVFALAGYEVNCACYSEILSQRDHQDFDQMFHFIGVAPHIRYGTFNQLCEVIINERGDLRQKVEQLIRQQAGNVVLEETQPTEKESVAKQEQSAVVPRTRPRVMLVDEVDVFFKQDFYGKLYRPFFMLKDTVITALMDWIWQQHDSDQTLSVHCVKTSPAYKACRERYPGFEFLVDSSIESLLKDIQAYQAPEHDYLVKDRQIMYRYQDGTSDKKHEGYKTMWAYYHEYHKNIVSQADQAHLAEHTGIMVHCGAFSYAEMLRDKCVFAHIIGFTGTLETLSRAEKAIMRDVFGIERYSYMPSAYGPNQLTFEENASVKVENDTDYHRKLLAEIQRAQIGSKYRDSRRPVMVFFRDMPALNAFRESLSAEMKTALSVMSETSGATVSERDAEIQRATSEGQMTLLTRTLGRGTDFVCYDPSVEANGGVHVIQTFLSKEVTEERQIQGRTARQGQQGSYSLVLREKDLHEVYGISAEQIKSMRADGLFYNKLHEMRCRHFEFEYQDGYQFALMPDDDQKLDHHVLYLRWFEDNLHYKCIKPDGSIEKNRISWNDLEGAGVSDELKPQQSSLEEFNAIRSIILSITSNKDHTRQSLTEQVKGFQKTCHAPSTELLGLVVRANQDEAQKAKELLMLFNQPSRAKWSHSRTVLLMDATGSMSNLIGKVKETIASTFSLLKGIFGENDIDKNCFEAQLCAYRNYSSGPSQILQASPWSTEPATLEAFMSGIQSSGGQGNEAIEIGLWHVNNEASKGEGVTQAILIGDMPPNTQEEVDKKRQGRDWSQTPYATPTFFQNEVNALARRQPPIPVHSFYVCNSAQEKFAEIATATEGETGELDIHSDGGAKRLKQLFANRVASDVAGEDDALREKLLKDCSVTFGA